MIGQIIIEEAYAQGKMLDHSGWYGQLPRGITPSDIDMIFDFDGLTVLVELKSRSADWGKVDVGQRRAYENLVRKGRGETLAICAKHVTEPGKQIDTFNDVTEYQVMVWRDGQIKTSVTYQGGWVEQIKKLAR